MNKVATEMYKAHRQGKIKWEYLLKESLGEINIILLGVSNSFSFKITDSYIISYYIIPIGREDIFSVSIFHPLFWIIWNERRKGKIYLKKDIDNFYKRKKEIAKANNLKIIDKLKQNDE